LAGLDRTSRAATVAVGGSCCLMTSPGMEGWGHGRARHVSFLLGKTRRTRAWRWIELWGLTEKFREVAFQFIHRLQNPLPQGPQVFCLNLLARWADRLFAGSSIFVSQVPTHVVQNAQLGLELIPVQVLRDGCTAAVLWLRLNVSFSQHRVIQPGVSSSSLYHHSVQK